MQLLGWLLHLTNGFHYRQHVAHEIRVQFGNCFAIAAVYLAKHWTHITMLDTGSFLVFDTSNPGSTTSLSVSNSEDDRLGDDLGRKSAVSTYSHRSIRSCTRLVIEPRPSPSQTLDVFDGVFHSALALSKDIRVLASWATLVTGGSSFWLDYTVFVSWAALFPSNVDKPFRAPPSGTLLKDTAT